MMRGPVAYDDGYISRKMSQLQTQPPPMAAAQAGGYGRQAPPPGYMQSGFEAAERGRGRSLGRPRSMIDPTGDAVQMQPRSHSAARARDAPGMAGSGAHPAGSLTAGSIQHVRQINKQIRQQQQGPPEKDAFITPYLWPEADIGAKKGWYRADFGVGRKTEYCYLPNPSDRLNFLEKRSVSPAPRITTMDSPLVTDPQVIQPMKQRADMFADNVQAETLAMKIEGTHRSTHRHRMLDDVVARAKQTDGYATRRSYYWQYPHYKGLASRRTTSLPRRWSIHETCPVHGTAVSTCSTRAADDTEVTELDGGYPPMAPAPMRRMPPPPPPPVYYDYSDYGYGGGYDYYGGYAYPPAPMAPPPMPRMSRYDQYLEEDPELAGMAAAGPMAPRQSLRPRTPPQVPTPIKGRGELPPTSMAEFDQRELEVQKSGKAVVSAHSRDLATKEPHTRSYLTDELPESEGERHLAKMSARYPSFSEPQMLQDHVDKMRIRLKSLAYSLDPTGPVPEIVIPERSGAIKPTPVESAEDSKKKYTMALEYKEMPNLSTRRSARTYPEDEYMKDNLRIKCLSHYKTTRTAADYWRPKLSNVSITDGTTTDAALPESYASKYTNKYQSKWEEPDTIYGSSSDKKPFSKPLAEICPAPEPTVERKKSKSKKTKEEPLVVEAAPPAEEPVSVVSDSALAEESMDPEADEKEKKKLEKKKRKAEREAAAKAAMEAELAALAAAEAELARLEQESACLATPAAPVDELAAPAPVEIPAVEVQSESAADKCESSSLSGGIIGVSVSGEEPPQQVTVKVVPEPIVTKEPPQVVEPPTPVLIAPAPPPEEEQQKPADSTAAAETSQ